MKTKSNPTEAESSRTVMVREFADVVRCPYCTGFMTVSYDAWVKLREKEPKMGRCHFCKRTFLMEITPWTYQ
jgi:NMD protein affecting ribosome stability and mRNA decay